MTAIDWSNPALSGGLFERIVGCLLGIEHPNSVRVRSSQGDGGVDVFNHVGGDIIDVYQAKFYRSRISWSKVEDSLTRLKSGKWYGYEVRNWYLTIPKQPTKEQVRHLRQLANGLPFTTGWFCEDQLDGLSSRHPEVGEYYLGDGKSRLAQLAQDWKSVLDPVIDEASPRIEDAHQVLTNVADALSRHDPHFIYGFDVRPVVVGPAPRPDPNVLLVSYFAVGPWLVSCSVYPRFRGAADEARDRLHVGLELGAEEQERLNELLAVGGSPLEIGPDGVASYTLPSVGHQAPDGTRVAIRVTPHVDVTPAAVRLVVTQASGSRVVTRLNRVALSRGTDGSTSEWRSPGGCLAMTMVERGMEQPTGFSLRCDIQSDVPIEAIAGDLGAIRSVQPGSLLYLSLVQGPIQPITSEVELVDEIAPQALIAALDALRVIQDHTRTVIKVPESMTAREVTDIVETAALLESLMITGDLRSVRYELELSASDLGPDADESLFGANFALELVEQAERMLKLPHQSIELADDVCFVRLLRSVRVAEIVDELEEDRARVALEPGPIPIWVDQRVDCDCDVPDEVRSGLYEQVDPITVEELSDALSRLGSQPSA